MNRDEAIKLILQRCGNRTDDTYLQQACVSEMALIQETTLEQADFKPWFLLSEFMRASTGVGEPRMPLPDNFLEEHDEGLFWVAPAAGEQYRRLNQDDVDSLEERFLDHSPQIPTHYGTVKNYAVLFPTPDKAYPLKLRCYQKEPLLTYAYGSESNQPVKTNAWLTHAADWVIGETGFVIASQYLKDRETAAEFQQQASRAKTRLYVQHVARAEANRDRHAGEED